MAETNKSIDFKQISILDSQIEVLLQCKPLPESEIKILCDKVRQTLLLFRAYLHSPAT